jgi:hypothetical protein
MATEFTGRSAEMRADTPWLAAEDFFGVGEVPQSANEICDGTKRVYWATKAKLAGVYFHKGAKFQDGRTKDSYTLAFEGKAKQYVLNTGNRKELVKRYGANVTAWKGKTVAIGVTEKKFKGEPVPGIVLKGE